MFGTPAESRVKLSFTSWSFRCNDVRIEACEGLVTLGGGVAAVEQNRLGREGIDVGRWLLRLPVAAEMVGTQRVECNEYDLPRVRRRELDVALELRARSQDANP